MRWDGLREFGDELGRMGERLRVSSARANFETAKEMRRVAIQNMSDLGIGLVTGRSRSLFGAQPDSRAFSTGGSVAAYAGYLEWEDGVVFYPKFLNDGTSRMMARPYYDLAFEQMDRFHDDAMSRALMVALTGKVFA